MQSCAKPYYNTIWLANRFAEQCLSTEGRFTTSFQVLKCHMYQNYSSVLWKNESPTLVKTMSDKSRSLAQMLKLPYGYPRWQVSVSSVPTIDTKGRDSAFSPPFCNILFTTIVFDVVVLHRNVFFFLTCVPFIQWKIQSGSYGENFWFLTPSSLGSTCF